MQEKRRWMGLVCPVCRFVFRVPKGHDGRGVICPACSHLLNLPANDKARKLVASETLAGNDQVAETLKPNHLSKQASKPIVCRPMESSDQKAAEPPKLRKRRGSKSRGSGESGLEWEQRTTEASGGSSGALYWIIGGCLFGVMLVLVGAKIVVDQALLKDDKNQGQQAVIIPPVVDPDQGEGNTDDHGKDQTNDEGVKLVVKTGQDIMRIADDLVGKFCGSKSIEEAAQYVRNPDKALPRMRSWYKDDPWKPFKIKKVGVGNRVVTNGAVASVLLQMDDYSKRNITIIKVGDEYKVDWESWVGWSSYRWSRLFDDKPTKPIEVRVLVSLDAYYNREFRDELKWQSVMMRHPMEERTLYGYFDRGNPEVARLVADLSRRKIVPMILSIKYPDGATVDDQVIVVDYHENGWVKRSDNE